MHHGDAGHRVPAQGPRRDEPHRGEGERRTRSMRGIRGRRARSRDPDRSLQGRGRPRRLRYVFQVEARGGIPAGSRGPPARARGGARTLNLEYLAKRQSRRLEGSGPPRDEAGWYDPRRNDSSRRRPAPVPGEDRDPLGSCRPRTLRPRGRDPLDDADEARSQRARRSRAPVDGPAAGRDSVVPLPDSHFSISCLNRGSFRSRRGHRPCSPT